MTPSWVRDPAGLASRNRIGRLITGGAGLIVLVAIAWYVRSVADAQDNSAGLDPVSVTVFDSTSTDATAMSAPLGTPLLEDVFSVWDATSDGQHWFVLDRVQRLVHRIDEADSLAVSVGGEGEGPGEFSTSPEAVAVHGDTVAVVTTLGHLTLFGTDGVYLQSRAVHHSECARPGIFGIDSTARGLLFLLYCPLGSQQEAFAALEAFDGTLRTLARYAPTPDSRRTVDPDFFPVLAAVQTGFLFGSAGDECLGLYALDGQVVDSVCHRWIQRIPLRGPALAERNELAARFRQSGLKLKKTGDQLPFDRVFAALDGILFYRVPNAEPPGSWHLQRKAPNGDQAMTVPFPSAPHVFASGDDAMLAWDDVEGTRFSIVPFPFR